MVWPPSPSWWALAMVGCFICWLWLHLNTLVGGRFVTQLKAVRASSPPSSYRMAYMISFSTLHLSPGESERMRHQVHEEMMLHRFLLPSDSCPFMCESLSVNGQELLTQRVPFPLLTGDFVDLSFLLRAGDVVSLRVRCVGEPRYVAWRRRLTRALSVFRFKLRRLVRG